MVVMSHQHGDQRGSLEWRSAAGSDAVPVSRACTLRYSDFMNILVERSLWWRRGGLKLVVVWTNNSVVLGGPVRSWKIFSYLSGPIVRRRNDQPYRLGVQKSFKLVF